MFLNACLHCGHEFTPNPRVQLQTYCSADACQRARRRQWQATKRKNDPDYHDNQARAQKAWCERHPEYWSNYRIAHPEYSAHNREGQLLRSGYSRLREVVGPEIISACIDLSSGHYLLAEISWHGIAKMDVIKVITVTEYRRQPTESTIVKRGRVRRHLQQLLN